MKRILILLIGLISVAQAQFAPTSTKSAFKWGISAGTRDSTAYGANDSLVVVINRQGRMMYRSTDGYWKILSNAGGSDFVPYTGAVDNVALGNYRLTARSIRMDSIYANGSGGAVAVTNSGTRSFSWGAGGSSEVSFYGFAGYDANRAGSYTARSFTDKNYVDSSAALRKAIADTFFTGGYTTRARTKQQIDSLSNAVSNGFVTIATNQDVTGRKSFTQNQIWFSTSQSGQTVGGNSSGIFFGNTNTIGGTQNVVLGFESTASGNQGIAIGNNARAGSSTANNNIAIGQKASEFITSGSFNISIGRRAANGLSTGSNNISIGDAAGYLSGTFPFALSTNTKSIFLGNNTRGLVDGGTNEIVIGDSVLGNGSNTVTIGNSSVTNNYFSGNIRGGAFIKSGGTSSQFLKADGSVDGTSYGTGSVTSVSAGTGMSFTTITSSGAVNADTTVLATRAYAAGLDVAKANTSLNNVNGVLSSTYGGAGSVNGILKANGSGVVSAAVAGTDYVVPSALSGYLPLSGGTLTGALSGTSATFTGAGTFQGADNGTALFLKRSGGVNVLAINVNSDGAFEMFDNAAGSFTSGMQQKNGNLGLGITPYAWSGGYRSLDNLIYNSLYSNNGGIGGLAFNAYQNGTNWIYKNTTSANRFESTLDQFKWFTAPSGTAGAAITFTERMNLSASQLTVNVPLSGTSLSMSGGVNKLGTTDDASSVDNITANNFISAPNSNFGNALLIRTDAVGRGMKLISANFNNGTNTGSALSFGTGNIQAFTNGNSSNSKLSLNPSGGNVLIKTTTESPNNEALQVNGSGRFAGSLDLVATVGGGGILRLVDGATESSIAYRISGGAAGTGWVAGNANNDFFIYSFTLGAQALNLKPTGAATFSSSVTATGFFESSDLRLKNIVKRDGDVVYFNWKNGQDKKLHIGYIAQEVQRTNPDQVQANESGFLSVNYTEVLVQKVRELEKQIAELKNRIK